MPTLLRFFLLLVLSLPLFSQADEVDCAALPDVAGDIQDLRDVDAAEGAARGEAILEQLYRAEGRCDEGEMLLLRALAANLHILGRHHEGLMHMRRALELLDRLPEATAVQRADMHLTAGLMHLELDAHDEAITHYLAAEQASKAAEDPISAARAAGNIGNLYNSTGDFERAREYHERALSGFESEGWTLGVAGTLVNLAALAGRIARHYESLEDPARVEQEYRRMLEDGRRALELFEDLENRRGIAHARTNVARAMAGLGRFREANDYQTLALEIQREVGDSVGEVESLLTMAGIEKSLGNLEQAAIHLQLAAEQVPEENLARLFEVAVQRTALEEARGDYRAALEHQKTQTVLRRRIATAQMATRVEEIRLAMEAEQREQELALLRREAEIADLRLKRQRTTSLAAVLLAALSLVLLAFMFSLYRVRGQRSRELEHVARTDALTGLRNRRDMSERLQASHRDCLVSGEVHGVILADIDDFKCVNDVHGHAVGDQVLQHIARLMAGTVKGSDLVARWGGEEFLILLPRTRLSGARSVAENLRRAIATDPARTDAGEMAPTLTMGVAELSAEISIDEAIRRADAAMYSGKEAGKNRQVAGRGDDGQVD